MRVMVTGSSGFLGTHLTTSLRSRGHTVVEFDVSAGCDIMDESVLAQTLERFSVTDVIHLAAIADLYSAQAKPEQAIMINIEGTRRVLSVCEKFKIPILFASTCCAYGNNGVHPSTEDAPLVPGELYAVTKVVAEGLFSLASDRHTIMRLATFYGPNQRSALATSVFLERARNGEPLIIHGDGNQTRTFTHVEDVVNGIICVLESSDRPRIVNISSEESHSVRELASLCMCLTQDVDIVHIEDRHGQILKEEIDSSILRNLGWAPEYDLSSGLKTCLMAHSPLEMNMQYHEAVVVE